MQRNWIAVASADHVRRGHAGNFMQVCHCKAGPLQRVQPGDYAVYYSPTESYRAGANSKLQAFTALGIVKAGAVYQVDMGGGFQPFRRDVTWLDAAIAAIRPLLDTLEFTAGQKHWGSALRFGLLTVSNHDFDLIAAAMDVRVPRAAA